MQTYNYCILCIVCLVLTFFLTYSFLYNLLVYLTDFFINNKQQFNNYFLVHFMIYVSFFVFLDTCVFHRQTGYCVMHELCDKCFSLPCQCSAENNSVLTLVSHLKNRLEIIICGQCSSAPCRHGKGKVYMPKGMSPNSINRNEKTVKTLLQ